MNIIKKIFALLTPKQMRICILLIVLMFFIAIFEALGIGLIYPLITMMGDPNYLENGSFISKMAMFFGIHTHKTLVIIATASILLFYILKNLLILLQGKLQISFSCSSFVFNLFC